MLIFSKFQFFIHIFTLIKLKNKTPTFPRDMQNNWVHIKRREMIKRAGHDTVVGSCFFGPLLRSLAYTQGSFLLSLDIHLIQYCCALFFINLWAFLLKVLLLFWNKLNKFKSTTRSHARLFFIDSTLFYWVSIFTWFNIVVLCSL